MRPSKNLGNRILSDTHWRVQLVSTKAQTHISQEPPLEYKILHWNQDQMPFTNQGWFWPFLTDSGVNGIFCSFGLVLEIPEPLRLEFLEKFSANNFALSDTKDNTSGPLINTGGVTDLTLLKTIVIHQKSREPRFWEVIDSFVLLLAKQVWYLREPFCNDYQFA